MYIGIDFGTSYSQAATVYHGKPFLLLPPNVYGIPSVFYYDRDIGKLVGDEALSWGQNFSMQNMVENIKMELLDKSSYSLDSTTFYSKDIISSIIRSTISIATKIAEQNCIDSKIDGAVLSIPAKFSIKERAMIREAIFSCLPENTPLHIIREPVAAALSYRHLLKPEGQYTLVFDLGGGTCDVAIVQKDPVHPELYHVRACDMLRIGGRDWDHALSVHIAKVIENESGKQIQKDQNYMSRIGMIAKKAKHDLSLSGCSKAVATIEIDGKRYCTVLTQQLFDEVTLRLLTEAIECIKKTMDTFPCEIDEIICVGGSSNMPQIKRKLTDVFAPIPTHLFTPEHAVVNGAALYSALYASELRLNEILHFSYGINTVGDDEDEIISNILIKGTPITKSTPAECSKYYCPAYDNMTELHIIVYESECLEERYNSKLVDCLQIGEVVVKLPKNASANTIIKCNFILSLDGILKVTAETIDKRELTVKLFKLTEI